MEIELYVRSRDIGAFSASQKEMVMHSYCAPQAYSNAINTLGKGSVSGILSREEQEALSLLSTVADSMDGFDFNIVIKDIRSLFARLKTWFKHRTITTPLVVIGDKCFKGTLSKNELILTIKNATHVSNDDSKNSRSSNFISE
ncbi:MAG: hypothetical protein ACFFC7_29585 [Candidatus Hermodarchaeota archaeon]